MKSEKMDRRVRYTKMVLKDSLISLLKEKPINKISIKEICEGADINRSTFYAHYTDQFQLMEQIEQEILEEITTRLEAYHIENSASESMQFLTEIFEYIMENQALCKVLLGEYGGRKFQKQVMQIVQQQLMPDLALPESKQAIGEYFYLFATHGSIGLVQKWLRNGLHETPAEMAQMVLQFTGMGLSSLLQP